MSEFALWVRRTSVALTVVGLVAATGTSWAKHGAGEVEAPEAPTIPDPAVAPEPPAPPANNPPAPEPPPAPVADPPAPPAPDPGPVLDPGPAPADPGPAPTPEPATLVLLATGAAGTVIARWRKRGR